MKKRSNIALALLITLVFVFFGMFVVSQKNDYKARDAALSGEVQSKVDIALQKEEPTQRQPEITEEEADTLGDDNAMPDPPIYEEDQDIPEDYQPQVSVYVSVYDKEYYGTYDYIEGMTAYQLSTQFFEDKDLYYRSTGFEGLEYIAQIGDLAEKQFGPMSGWYYFVNGMKPDYGSNSYYLGDGDIVVWWYDFDSQD